MAVKRRVLRASYPKGSSGQRVVSAHHLPATAGARALASFHGSGRSYLPRRRIRGRAYSSRFQPGLTLTTLFRR